MYFFIIQDLTLLGEFAAVNTNERLLGAIDSIRRDCYLIDLLLILLPLFSSLFLPYRGLLLCVIHSAVCFSSRASLAFRKIFRPDMFLIIISRHPPIRMHHLQEYISMSHVLYCVPVRTIKFFSHYMRDLPL